VSVKEGLVDDCQKQREREVSRELGSPRNDWRTVRCWMLSGIGFVRNLRSTGGTSPFGGGGLGAIALPDVVLWAVEILEKARSNN
jgi:hypothetical protein